MKRRETTLGEVMGTVEPPTFVKEIGKRTVDTLVVIPFHLEYDYLSRHLELLSAQTFQNFNVIFITSDATDKNKVEEIVTKKKRNFGVIIVCWTGDAGATMAYYRGQRFCLDNGYGYVILSDVDCLPSDSDLMEELVKKRENGVVLPCYRYVDEEGIPVLDNKYGNVTFYGLISAKIMKRYGLIFAPAYQGADDIEYCDRLKSEKLTITKYCEHPIAMKAFDRYDKYWLYLLNYLLILTSGRALFDNFINFTVSTLTNLIFSPPYAKKNAVTLLRLLLTYTYGKAAKDALKADLGGATVASVGLENFNEVRFGGYGGFTKMSAIPRQMLGSFRKNIIILQTSQVFRTITLNSIVARKIYLKLSSGKYLLVVDNSSFILHIFKVLLFILLLPPYTLTLLVFYVLLKILKQPKTMGYGLD